MLLDFPIAVFVLNMNFFCLSNPTQQQNRCTYINEEKKKMEK